MQGGMDTRTLTGPRSWLASPAVWLAVLVVVGLGLRTYHYLRNPAVGHEEAAQLRNLPNMDVEDRGRLVVPDGRVAQVMVGTQAQAHHNQDCEPYGRAGEPRPRPGERSCIHAALHAGVPFSSQATTHIFAANNPAPHTRKGS